MRRTLRLVLGLTLLATLPGKADAAALVASAQSFGAVGDGKTDDWWSIQQGIESLAARGGGTLLLPGTKSNTYIIRQALRMRTGVIVNVQQPTTTVKCTGDYYNGGKPDPTGADVVYINRWPLYGCVMFGSLVNAPNVSNLPTLPVNPVQRQGNWVQFVKKGDAAALSVGDLVMTTTADSFTIGGEYFPRWGEMDRIEQVDKTGGRVLLRYSPAKGIAISALRPLAPPRQFWARGDGPLPNQSIGIPLWASWQSGVVGGTWIAKAANGFDLPFSAGGGGLDCTLKPHAVYAGWGVGSGNLLSHCQSSVDHEEISVTPFEEAYMSSDNQVSIGDIVLTAATRISDWVINIDEGSHDNKVKIASLTVLGNGVKNIVSIVAAQNNALTIGAVSGRPIQGSVVAMFAYTYAGIYPMTQYNTVEVDKSSLSLPASYINFGNFSVLNNKVVSSNFTGSAAPSKGIIGASAATGNATQNVQMH